MMCIDVWEKHGCPTLSVNDVENDCSMDAPKIINNKADLSKIIKGILENQLWAKLIGNDFFIHFGWDFCMYFGTQLDQSSMSDMALSHNLYSEEMDSPYTKDD